MCGIAGIWNFQKKVDPKTLERFTSSVKHRGPDGAGFYYDDSEGVGLGHQRLAILDLTEKGRQPMTYTNGRYWITYNGEVYNFLELKKELEGHGYDFHSQTDTEIVLAAYDRWGADCQCRFNGAWAFAIWDAEEKKLFLSRDRFGIKPLYYLYIPGEMFVFASETFAFSYLDNYNREFNEANVACAIRDTFLLEGLGHTIFEGIYQVLPGHFMFISRDKVPLQKRWWSTLKHIRPIHDSYDKQVEDVRGLFQNACAIRMQSDVPIATALSGGIDSSSVYCMLRNIMNNDSARSKRVPTDWHRAFTLTFPKTDLDEREYVANVIEYTNGNVTYVDAGIKGEDLVEYIVSTTRKSDYIAISPNPAYYIYNSMRKENIVVSLDGHGPDEMLFGYPPLVKIAYLEAMRQDAGDDARDLFNTFIEMQEPWEREDVKISILNARKRDANLFYKIYDKYIPMSAKEVYRQLRRIFNKECAFYGKWLRLPNNRFLRSVGDKEDLSRLAETDKILYLTFHQTLLPTILRNFDRASMANGVEGRMPFLDWRLVTYIFSLPLKSKIGGGYTKRIIRDAMVGVMPDSIRTRKLKLGLSVPMPEWLSGPLRRYVMDIVNSKAFLKSTVWNGPLIRDFTEKRMKKGIWEWHECDLIWPCINTYILMQ